MSDQKFDVGDVIAMMDGTNEKFIVVDDIFGFGVYVNRVDNGHRDWQTGLVPNNAKCMYLKIGTWDYKNDRERDGEEEDE